jgi:TM2 domain-containing membrane protein YozV
MYKIIGADGREYGPITAEQLRQWISEGRANGWTKVQTEGTTEWKTLADFPEFHGSVGVSDGTPPPLSVPAPVPDATQPAGPNKKIAAGICGILLGCLGIHKFILGYTGAGLTMLLITVLTCGVASPITGLIGFIEGIIYLTKSDEEFAQMYVRNKKAWF